MTDTRTGGGRYIQDPVTGELTKVEPVDQAPAAPPVETPPADGDGADTDTSGKRTK
jgi:hypothetical protein